MSDASHLPTMHDVTSSNIEAVGHDRDRLFVKFRSGATWRYDQVPEEAFQALRSADSVGGHFVAKIRGHYQGTKL